LALSETDCDKFRAILGEKHVLCDADSLATYAVDETHAQSAEPDLVLKPASVNEISSILSHCNKMEIPVVPRGGGSGVSGGALAHRGGVVLCLERLNRIIRVDHDNQTLTVETGAITGMVQEHLVAQGLCLPPDPGSREFCQIGGNLAECAAGPKSVKYGAFRDYVLNLEVVLPSGEIIWTGANVRKMACGYNLTQLMLGSEGTLGIITKAVFKVIRAPSHQVLMRLSFNSLAAAAQMITRTFAVGLVPSELEFVDAHGIAAARPNCQEKLPDQVAALLWIGFDGHDEEVLTEDAVKISDLADELGSSEALIAEQIDHRIALWEYRQKVGEAIIEAGAFRDVDVSFPRSQLQTVVEGARRIGAEKGFRVVCFGHSGDGNLHIQILRGDLDEAAWNGPVNDGIRELYELVVGLGGALSGEHGIGCTLTPYMDTLFSATHLALMAGIKAVFDPKGILNPGKILP